MDSSTPTHFNNLFGSNLSNVFAGVKLDAGGGDYVYGWVRFSTGPDSGEPGGGPSTVTIFDAAFESTVNQGITTGAVPEPSTIALLSLAGGAMAFRHCRRRQRPAA